MKKYPYNSNTYGMADICGKINSQSIFKTCT